MWCLSSPPQQLDLDRMVIVVVWYNLEGCIRNIQSDTSRESNRSDKSPRWWRGRLLHCTPQGESRYIKVLCTYMQREKVIVLRYCNAYK